MVIWLLFPGLLKESPFKGVCSILVSFKISEKRQDTAVHFTVMLYKKEKAWCSCVHVLYISNNNIVQLSLKCNQIAKCVYHAIVPAHAGGSTLSCAWSACYVDLSSSS